MTQDRIPLLNAHYVRHDNQPLRLRLVRPKIHLSEWNFGPNKPGFRSRPSEALQGFIGVFHYAIRLSHTNICITHLSAMQYPKGLTTHNFCNTFLEWQRKALDGQKDRPKPIGLRSFRCE